MQRRKLSRPASGTISCPFSTRCTSRPIGKSRREGRKYGRQMMQKSARQWSTRSDTWIDWVLAVGLSIWQQ
ncbi:hypothetical protein BJX61DRAFT_526881 [Aspergillus egyptiacus]|nr:hypothetical protein BJX61DRAFT_526881 [Aspergillus egyptiacus]